MNKFDRNLPWILIGLGIVLLVAIVAQIVTSLPPNTVTFLTGREGGAYYLAAQYYQQLAEQKGFTVNIVPTAGSVEALRMLENGEGDVAFIQGGVAAQGNPEKVSALATVGFEPLWIFYRRELAPSEHLDSPLQLQGMRISVGEAGSGTNDLARILLADYGITDESATLLELSAASSLEQLRAGNLDAALVVASNASPIIGEYVADRTIEIMSMGDADALSRRHQFLTVLTLPRGAYDLVDVRPREDIALLSTSANLLVRNGLHPDLLRLLAVAAVEIHSASSFFAPRNFFPNTDNTDLPVSKEGETYLQRIKNREFTLDRYLPFWLSAVFDRYLLFVVPVLLILLPMLSRSPVLYQMYMRRKVNRWYKEIRRIETNVETMNVEQVDTAVAELRQLDAKLTREISVSNDYMPNLYTLRTHIEYVVQRLHRRRADLAAAASTPVAV
jgi:TRAP transporter TAXI family solute receptor